MRLRDAYLVTCTGVEKDGAGVVTRLRCRYDPATRGGDAPDGRKVKGTLHWVSARHALPAEVRLFDRLFTVEEPEEVPEGGDFTMYVNPESRVVRTGCFVESTLADAVPGDRFQFERLGYFCVDLDSAPGSARLQPHRDPARQLGAHGLPQGVLKPR